MKKFVLLGFSIFFFVILSLVNSQTIIQNCPSGYVYDWTVPGSPTSGQIQTCIKREVNVPCSYLTSNSCNRVTYLSIPVNTNISAYGDNLLWIFDMSSIGANQYYSWRLLNNGAIVRETFSTSVGFVTKIVQGSNSIAFVAISGTGSTVDVVVESTPPTYPVGYCNSDDDCYSTCGFCKSKLNTTPYCGGLIQPGYQQTCKCENNYCTAEYIRINTTTTIPSATCTDSDGDINYYQSGCVSVCFYNGQVSGCGQICDSCTGNTLTENYCDGSVPKSLKYECPNGCNNGACVPPINKTPTCSAANLVATFSPVSQGAANGQTLIYAVNIVNNNDVTCGTGSYSLDAWVAYYPASYRQPGWTITGLPTTQITLSPGGSLTFRLLVTSPSNADPKVYTIFLSADSNVIGQGYYKLYTSTTTIPTTIPINTIPTIQITSPKNGQTISGGILVVIEASGNNGLGDMTLSIQKEGESVAKLIPLTNCGGGEACPTGGACVYTKSCNYYWDTSGYDGMVVLTATIIDDNNNRATDSTKVSVVNYQSCSDQCTSMSYRYGSCKNSCDENEINIGPQGCPQVACAPCVAGQQCPPCQTNTCCCVGKRSCPYDCCSNDPDYLDKPCPMTSCPVCLPGQVCPECIQAICINHQCNWQSQEQFILNLKAGWNMFSFPIDVRSYLTATNQSVKEITVEKAITGQVTGGVGGGGGGGVTTVSCPTPAHIWHYSNGKYVDVLNDPSSLVNGWGYWVKMSSDCTATLTGNKITVNDFPELDVGWNQIGAPSEAVNFYSVIGNCNLLSGPWWYNPVSNNYEKIQVLKPGEGYWVEVKDKCKLGTEIPPLPPGELSIVGKALKIP